MWKIYENIFKKSKEEKFSKITLKLIRKSNFSNQSKLSSQGGLKKK